MDRSDWDELVAQVEENGPGPLEFYLSSDLNNPLNILSIKNEDGEIVVVLDES